MSSIILSELPSSFATRYGLTSLLTSTLANKGQVIDALIDNLNSVLGVVNAHGGRLDLDEGPGAVPGAPDGHGPGLRVALSLPAVE